MSYFILRIAYQMCVQVNGQQCVAQTKSPLKSGESCPTHFPTMYVSLFLFDFLPISVAFDRHPYILCDADNNNRQSVRGNRCVLLLVNISDFSLFSLSCTPPPLCTN